jgi:hypothetical protein
VCCEKGGGRDVCVDKHPVARSTCRQSKGGKAGEVTGCKMIESDREREREREVG